MSSSPSASSGNGNINNSNNSTQKRRKYSTRACVFCRNRHKKCDGGMPCLACDQRKQECVYPEQQKKRGPKPRASLINGNTESPGKTVISTSSGKLGSPESVSSKNCASVAILTASRDEQQVVRGLQQMHMGDSAVHSKSKRRRLSSNSEERLPTVRDSMMLPDRSNSLNEDVIGLCNLLQEIIQIVQQHPRAFPFLKPVSIADAPDYYDIILQPMDFSTVAKKINSYQYVSLSQFYNDLNLIVENCRKYNQETRSAYLIDWVLELQQFVLEEIQKRTSEAIFLIPQPIDQLDHFDNYRQMPNHHHFEISDHLYEIDRFQLVYTDQQIFPENWNIFAENIDLLEYSLSSSSQYADNFYGEENMKLL